MKNQASKKGVRKKPDINRINASNLRIELPIQRHYQ